MTTYQTYSIKFEGGETTVGAISDQAALEMAEEIAQELEVDCVEVWRMLGNMHSAYVGSRP